MKTSFLARTKGFFILLILCSFSLDSFAGVIVPIPFIIGGGGAGSVSQNKMLSLWLAINLYLIIYFIVRAMVYTIFKNKIRWTKKMYQYIITDRFNYEFGFSSTKNIGFAMILFISVNGSVLLIATAEWIGAVLK